MYYCIVLPLTHSYVFFFLFFFLLAGNEEKDINDTACNKNSRKKRTIQKKISPALSQDEEVEPDTPQPRKGAKASVRQRKTSVVSVQGE